MHHGQYYKKSSKGNGTRGSEKMKLGGVVQGAVRGSVTSEWGLHDWVEFVKHKLQREQRPTLCLQRIDVVYIRGKQPTCLFTLGPRIFTIISSRVYNP